MKTLIIAALLSSACIFAAAQDSKSELPPLIRTVTAFDYTEDYEKLKALIPGLSEQKIDAGVASTEAKSAATLWSLSFGGEFNFAEGRLISWGYSSLELEHADAVEKLNSIIAELESSLGPAQRAITLPGDSDGPRDEITLSFGWLVNGRDFGFSCRQRAKKSTLSFGAQHLFCPSGAYLLGDEKLKNLAGTIIGRKDTWTATGITGYGDKCFVLRKLLERGVYGKRPQYSAAYGDYGQEVVLHGGRENNSSEFNVSWFNVRFPVTITRVLPNASRFTETHFGMTSLFPDGLEYNGKKVDLTQFEDWQSGVPESLKAAKPESSK